MEQKGNHENACRSIEEQLHHEIRVLTTAMSKIERHIENPHERRVYDIYGRILAQRKELLCSLGE
jgi:hypothetical protein